MAHERKFYEYVLGRVVLRTLLLLGVIVFGFLAVDNWVVRWDLTEDERFSISPASHRIAASLPDPLTIRAYFSGRIPEWVVPMQRQVFDILAEYEAHSNGKIKVERYDPLDSTAARSEATGYGVRQIQLMVREATGESYQEVYGSIVLVYGDRAPKVIDIAKRYPEGYQGLSVLEYEISSSIWQLTHDRVKIGLTGYLDREGRGNPMMGMQQPTPEYAGLRAKLGESFDVEDADLDRQDLDPKKVPLLLVVRPKDFTDVALFRLDQYLMKGGRVLLFITQGTIDTGYDRRFAYTPFRTGLDAWLEHNGVRVPNEFVVHWLSAREIPVPRGVVDTPFGKAQITEPMPNWFWPMMGNAEALEKANPAVQPLKLVSMWWPHPVDLLEGRLEGRKATVLVRSHAEESWRWKDLRRIDRRGLSDEDDAPATSDLASSPVAVALEGTFKSYFADKPVPPSLTAEKPKPEGEGNGEGPGNPEGDNPAAPEVIKETVAPTQMVVVGNAFFLCDLLVGQNGEAADRAAPLALNLVDWLGGSPELIAIRSKNISERRFVDKDHEERMKEAGERHKRGEISDKEYQETLQGAEEQRKAQWKRSRWMNIILPCFVIVLAGAIVWVVRAASRAGPPRIPQAVPPASLSGGGTDS